MTLYANWKRILRKAWSMRLMAVAALLTGCEVVLPLFGDSIPRNVFAGLSFVVVIGAMIARITYQKELE